MTGVNIVDLPKDCVLTIVQKLNAPECYTTFNISPGRLKIESRLALELSGMFRRKVMHRPFHIRVIRLRAIAEVVVHDNSRNDRSTIV